MGPTLDTKAAKNQLKNLAVLLLAVGVSVVFVLWRIGSESGQIQQLCEQAQGKTLAQLNGDIEKRGLIATFSQGSAIVHGSKTMGRTVCLIEYADGAVTKAQFNNAD